MTDTPLEVRLISQGAQQAAPDEHWTPADQQAFAEFMRSHFPNELDSFAIQSLGSAWKDGQANGMRAAPTPPAQQSQWVTDQFLPAFRKRLQWYDDVDFVRMADMETIIAEATGDTAAPEQECPNCFEGKSDHHHTCRKCGGTGKSIQQRRSRPSSPP